MHNTSIKLVADRQTDRRTDRQTDIQNLGVEAPSPELKKSEK